MNEQNEELQPQQRPKRRLSPEERRRLEERRRKRKRIRRIRKAIKLIRFFGIPILLLIVAISLLGHFIKGNDSDSKTPDQEVSSTIKPEKNKKPKEPEIYNASILSAGDIILHSPFISSTIYRQADGSYDYNSMFDYIKDDYADADFTVVNLELTVSDGNYSGYPLFRSPDAITEAIANSEADLCLLANNHIYDNTDKGLVMTMESVDNHSLLYTGTRKSSSDSTYLVKDINGIKVGIFNYVYETGSTDPQKLINGNPVSSASADLINTFHYDALDTFYSEIQNGLKEMKKQGVEYTIAYLHWGNKYQTTESSYQREMANKLCELGIDALIGGHPHVIQPVDLLKDSTGTHQMLCVYSMGNHISNQRQELMDSMPYGHTEDGLMIKLTLEQIDDGAVSLTEAEFIPTWVYKTLANGGAEYYVMPLDDPDAIIQEASTLNIATDVQNSLKRTNEIIGEGVEKVQNALPISTNN